MNPAGPSLGLSLAYGGVPGGALGVKEVDLFFRFRLSPTGRGQTESPSFRAPAPKGETARRINSEHLRCPCFF